jgi:hypothetical protein
VLGLQQQPGMIPVSQAQPQAAALFEQMSSQAAAGFPTAASLLLQQQQQQQQHHQQLVAVSQIVSNSQNGSINSISSTPTLPTFSPLFNVPQTSSVNSNFFAAALQQQIATANSIPGGIAAAGQHHQPFATALQQQIAQIHQHQQQQQQQQQQQHAAAIAAAQLQQQQQNPFMTFALNAPGGFAAHQNQLLAAAQAAAAQGHHPHPGALGHPGGLLFFPRLP